MVVADAVAEGRYPEARHALHQAGGEPAETAIAERRVGFGAAHPVEIDPEIAERGGDGFGQPQILDDIGEQAADQEFERQIIDVLLALGAAGAVDRQPAMDDPVAQGERGGDEPVARGRAVAVLADRERQLGENARLERLDIGLRRRDIGDRGRVAAAGIAEHQTKIGQVFGHGINVRASAGPESARRDRFVRDDK